MSVTTPPTTIGTTPTRIFPPAGYTGPTSVCVKNTSDIAIRLGGADVDQGYSFPLLPGESFSQDLGPTEALYGIAASAVDVAVIGNVGQAR